MGPEETPRRKVSPDVNSCEENEAMPLDPSARGPRARTSLDEIYLDEPSEFQIDENWSKGLLPTWYPRKIEPFTPLVAYKATIQAFGQAMRDYVTAPRADLTLYYTTLGPYRSKVEIAGRLMCKVSNLLMGDRLRMRAYEMPQTIQDQGVQSTLPCYDQATEHEVDRYLYAVHFWSVQEAHLRFWWSEVTQSWDLDMRTEDGSKQQKRYSSFMRDDALDVKALDEEIKMVEQYMQDVDDEVEQLCRDFQITDPRGDRACECWRAGRCHRCQSKRRGKRALFMQPFPRMIGWLSRIPKVLRLRYRKQEVLPPRPTYAVKSEESPSVRGA